MLHRFLKCLWSVWPGGEEAPPQSVSLDHDGAETLARGQPIKQLGSGLLGVITDLVCPGSEPPGADVLHQAVLFCSYGVRGLKLHKSLPKFHF